MFGTFSEYTSDWFTVPETPDTSVIIGSTKEEIETEKLWIDTYELESNGYEVQTVTGHTEQNWIYNSNKNQYVLKFISPLFLPKAEYSNNKDGYMVDVCSRVTYIKRKFHYNKQDLMKLGIFILD